MSRIAAVFTAVLFLYSNKLNMLCPSSFRNLTLTFILFCNFAHIWGSADERGDNPCHIDVWQISKTSHCSTDKEFTNNISD